MTPGKAVAVKQRLGIKRLGSRLKFFGETVSELKKVVWPTRQEAIRLSIMVIIVSIVVAVILGAFDYGFFRLVQNVFLSR